MLKRSSVGFGAVALDALLASEASGEVKGVRLADGETIEGKTVVTAVDPRQALSELLTEDALTLAAGGSWPTSRYI